MSAVVTSLIVLATLAFGAVYPWGYLPLALIAACIGVAGLIRRGIPGQARTLLFGLVLVALAIAAQLVPLSRPAVDAISPNAAWVLERYSLAFAAGSAAHPLSINPSSTASALVGVGAFILYVVGLPALLSRKDLRALPRNLIVFGVLLALIGIFGREHNNGLVYGFWQPEEGTNGNGFGPFVNRNHFAGWMLMTTCLTMGVLCGRIEPALAGVKSGARRRFMWLSTPEANRIVLIGVCTVVMAISLVWTMSRSGIVSFTCALGCFAWLVTQRHGVRQVNRVVALIALGVVLIASVSRRGLDPLLQWFGDTTDLVSRFAAWRDGWQVVRDFPIAGTGISTYPDAMLFYQKHVLDFWMTHAHNDYLQLLAEGGLLVAVPVAIAAALFVVAIRRTVDGARDNSYDYWVRAGAAVGLIAIAIQETVEFSLHIPANVLLFSTLAAVAIAPVRRRVVAGEQVSTE